MPPELHPFVHPSIINCPVCKELYTNVVRPNKKITTVFWERGQGRHTYFYLNYFFFFLEKNINLCILKGVSPYKLHKKFFFSENLKKSRFHK